MSVGDGEHDFDPLVEVAFHPVRRADEDALFPTMMEGEDAHVLEVLVNDRDDLDIFSRLETANASDIELNIDSGIGCAVERVDDIPIFQRIHLGADLRFFSFERFLGLVIDQLDDFAL